MQTVQWPPSVGTQLRGNHVTVSTTAPTDAAELFTALDDERVWRHLTAARPSGIQGMHEQVVQACSSRFPWTIRLRASCHGVAAGSVVGWSSYLEVSAHDARLEIGSTAYSPAVWRSAVNTETKLLLLGHAFDDLRFSRVQLKTDVRNDRSIKGIEGIGAKHEGVLRRYQRRADGTIRDTVVFAIISDDWPGIRERLRRRLDY